jgi:pyridoxamine 5'-phosphate oxidase
VNARIESLHLIESACWREIERAAREREHAWRTMALATVRHAATDGAASADARIVILREASSSERELIFFTDDRSPKLAQLRRHPQGTLVLWSARLGWQLRLRVRLAAEEDGLQVSSRWARLKLTPSAQDYLSPEAPGTPLLQPSTERAARDYFAVIRAQVQAMDWLELHADGHRRAIFDAQGARWVQP